MQAAAVFAAALIILTVSAYDSNEGLYRIEGTIRNNIILLRVDWPNLTPVAGLHSSAGTQYGEYPMTGDEKASEAYGDRYMHTAQLTGNTLFDGGDDDKLSEWSPKTNMAEDRSGSLKETLDEMGLDQEEKSTANR